MTVRPRDRKPLPVDVTVTAWRGEWCWVMTELALQSAEIGTSKDMPVHGRTTEHVPTE